MSVTEKAGRPERGGAADSAHDGERPQYTHNALEAAIAAATACLIRVRLPLSKRLAWRSLARLHPLRVPETVARLERQRGLR